MKTHTITYKKICPFCGSSKTNFMFFCDGLDFTSVDVRCASCRKQYHLSMTITDKYFVPLKFLLMDKRIETIDNMSVSEYFKGRVSELYQTDCSDK